MLLAIFLQDANQSTVIRSKLLFFLGQIVLKAFYFVFVFLLQLLDFFIMKLLNLTVFYKMRWLHDLHEGLVCLFFVVQDLVDF